jgi:hypothetical protein
LGKTSRRGRRVNLTREFGFLRTNDLQNASKSQNKTAAVCLARVLTLLSGGVKFQLNERKFTPTQRNASRLNRQVPGGALA